MQVVHRSGPVPATNRQPNDAQVEGTAKFEVILYENGEPIPQGDTGISVADFRSKLVPGDLRFPAGSRLIPSSIWQKWPDDARVVYRASWRKNPS
jgi:hypothetical protein